MRIAYDGWALVHTPCSPAGLHLLALLHALPESVKPVVLLPGEPPGWLPRGVEIRSAPTAGADIGRWRWSRKILPELVKESKADLLHLTAPQPALFSSTPAVLSPAAPQLSSLRRNRPAGGRSLVARLLEASAPGGASRLRGVFWPRDLAGVQELIPSSRTFILPTEPWPVLSPAAPVAGLPERYVLYCASLGDSSLEVLLEAWRWAAGPLGSEAALLVVGVEAGAAEKLARLAGQAGLGDSLRVLDGSGPVELLSLIQRSAAVLHLGEAAPWGDVLRLALAAGAPVVGEEGELVNAMAGPAAYLAPAGDGRGLGAALITVVLEESVADGLLQAAQQSRAEWQDARFGEQLWGAYRQVLEGAPGRRN